MDIGVGLYELQTYKHRTLSLVNGATMCADGYSPSISIGTIAIKQITYAAQRLTQIPKKTTTRG